MEKLSDIVKANHPPKGMAMAYIGSKTNYRGKIIFTWNWERQEYYQEDYYGSPGRLSATNINNISFSEYWDAIPTIDEIDFKNMPEYIMTPAKDSFGDSSSSYPYQKEEYGISISADQTSWFWLGNVKYAMSENIFRPLKDNPSTMKKEMRK